ncbi:unnamed protein product [Camellia sinensis]
MLLEELNEKQMHEVRLQEELEGLKDFLRSEKQNLMEVTSDRDQLRSLCDKKDSAHQAALLDKRSMEASLAKLTNLGLESNAKKELVEANNQVLQKIQDELKMRSAELHVTEETAKRLVNEKQLLEERIVRLEKTKVEEIEVLEKNIEQERKAMRLRVAELKWFHEIWLSLALRSKIHNLPLCVII